MHSAELRVNPAEPLQSRHLMLQLKRLLDLVLAGALLLVISPLIIPTILAIYFDLGRPLMFEQERVGKALRIFVVRKFRTMTDARDVNGVLLPDELRQTALSAFLRRIRLDELPQLLSVLRGELSFVGPRPLPMSLIAALGRAGALRCAIAPGMTGWAQVNGNTLLTMEEKIALDIWYIDRWSLWKDIQIVGMTVRTILFGEKVNRRNVELALTHFHQRTWAPGSVAEDL